MKRFIAKIIGYIVCFTFIVILVGTFVGGIYGLIHAIQTKNKGVEVSATIASVTSRKYHTKYGTETDYTAYVDYTYNGTKYHETYKYYNHTQKKGDVITITINSEKPEDILSYKDELITSILQIMIFVSLVVFRIIRNARRYRLKKLGVDINDDEAIKRYYDEKKRKS